MSRKIVIFGSYNNSSIGDTAILLGLISSIRRNDKDCLITVLVIKTLNLIAELEAIRPGLGKNVEEVTVFDSKESSNNLYENIKWFSKKISRKLLKNTPLNKRKVAKFVSDADHLLIGGGNLIMDLFPTWPFILNEVIEIAKNNNIPFSLIGVGAGPINTPEGKAIFNNCLIHANQVFFRDMESLNYCVSKLGFRRAKVAPDCAFGINFTSERRVTKKKLLVNVAPVFSKKWPYQSKVKYKKYISAVNRKIEYLMDINNYNEIVIYNTNYPLDEEAVSNLITKLHDERFNVTHLKGQLTVKELLDICSEAELALVTRLHAGIIAVISGCSIIAIAYQPKVKDVLNSIGIHENIIEIEDFIIDTSTCKTPKTYEPINLSIIRTELDNTIKHILDM